MLAWILLFCALAAPAAPPTIEVHLWPRLAPRNGKTYPVVVDLHTDSLSGFKGWLRAAANGQGVPFAQRVDVAKGSYRFHLYPVWNDAESDPAELEVSLWDRPPDSGGRPLTTQTFPLVERDYVWTIGVLASHDFRLSDGDLAPLTLDALARARLLGPMVMAAGGWSGLTSGSGGVPTLASAADLDAARARLAAGDPVGAAFALLNCKASGDPSLSGPAEELSNQAWEAAAMQWLERLKPGATTPFGIKPRIDRVRLGALADVELLPDRWYGYQCIDTLWWHATLDDYVSPDQRQALADWVRLGGNLLLAGDPANPRWKPPFSVPGLDAADDVPCGFGRVAIVHDSPAALAALPRDQLLALLGCPADFVYRVDDPRFRGINDDLALMESRSESDTLDYLAHSYARRVGDGNLTGGALYASNDISSARLMAAAAGHVDFPLGRLLRLGLLYLLGISLADYLLARLTRRPLLTWFTWPLLIVGASMAAYHLFYAPGAGSETRFEFSLIDIDDSRAVAAEQTVACARLGNASLLELAAGRDELWTAPPWNVALGSLSRTSQAGDIVSARAPARGYCLYQRQPPARPDRSPMRISLDGEGMPVVAVEPGLDWRCGWLVIGRRAWYIDRPGQLLERNFGPDSYYDLSLRIDVRGTFRNSAHHMIVGEAAWEAVQALDSRPEWPAHTFMFAPPPPAWSQVDDGRARVILITAYPNPDGLGERPGCLRIVTQVHREAPP